MFVIYIIHFRNWFIQIIRLFRKGPTNGQHLILSHYIISSQKLYYWRKNEGQLKRWFVGRSSFLLLNVPTWNFFIIWIHVLPKTLLYAMSLSGVLMNRKSERRVRIRMEFIIFTDTEISLRKLIIRLPTPSALCKGWFCNGKWLLFIKEIVKCHIHSKDILKIQTMLRLWIINKSKP